MLMLVLVRGIVGNLVLVFFKNIYGVFLYLILECLFVGVEFDFCGERG